MVLKQYMVLMAGLVLMGACRGSQNVATKAKKAGDISSNSSACNVAVAAGNPVLNWKTENNSVLKETTMTLPANYKLYSLDSAELKAFFSAAKMSKEDSKAEIVIPLPAPWGCKVFSVFESGTMSEELRKRFPDIVTLKGMDKETPLSDIRLEYNGSMMQGQVTRDGETYYIKPVTNNNMFYYMVYSKSDMQEAKKAFEENNKSTINDNKPVILKYDR